MRFNFVVKTVKSVGIEAKNETEALELLYSLKEKIISIESFSHAHGFSNNTLDHEKIEVDLLLKKEKAERKGEPKK